MFVANTVLVYCVPSMIFCRHFITWTHAFSHYLCFKLGHPVSRKYVFSTDENNELEQMLIVCRLKINYEHQNYLRVSQ